MKKIFIIAALFLFSAKSFSQVFIDGARGGGISPSGNTYAAYYNQFLQGGVKVVYDVTARNALASYLRDTSILVFTKSDSTFWTLTGGVTNANWVKVGFARAGGSGGGGGGTGRVYAGYGLQNTNDSTLEIDSSITATMYAVFTNIHDSLSTATLDKVLGNGNSAPFKDATMRDLTLNRALYLTNSQLRQDGSATIGNAEIDIDGVITGTKFRIYSSPYTAEITSLPMSANRTHKIQDKSDTLAGLDDLRNVVLDYVPYRFATKSLDMGAFDIKSNAAKFGYDSSFNISSTGDLDVYGTGKFAFWHNDDSHTYGRMYADGLKFYDSTSVSFITLDVNQMTRRFSGGSVFALQYPSKAGKYALTSDIYDSSANYVKYTDSITKYATPKQLHDSVSSVKLGTTVANADTTSHDIKLIADQFDNSYIGEKLVQARSTGLISGGIITINGSDASKFDMAAGQGLILNYTSIPARIKNVTIPARTAQTVTNIASQDQTFILIDTTGAIIQSPTFPSPTQRRQYIYAGRLSHSSRTTIGTAETTPDFTYSLGGQYYDFLDAYGKFNISGNVITANDGNLKLDKSAGKVFARSSNYANNILEPHTPTTGALTALSFKYNTRTLSLTTSLTDLDPTNYDNGGTVTAISGSGNQATIQRLFLFPNNVIRIQYGGVVYPSLNAATAAISTEVSVINPILGENAVPIALIAITKNATALNNSSMAAIFPISKGSIGGGNTFVLDTITRFTGIATLGKTYNDSLTLSNSISLKADKATTITVGSGTSAQDISTNRTFLGNVPNVDATNATNITSGTLPNARLSAVPNSSLANSSVTINGTSVSLGGSATVTAAAGTLTGTTLNSTVTGSSLTSVGTLTGGVWNATPLIAAYLPSTTVYTGQANTYTAGFKQTFTASSTTAGINIAGTSTNPSSPSAGDLHYRTDDGSFRWYDGVNSTFRTAANLTGTQTFTNKTIDYSSNTITGVTPLKSYVSLTDASTINWDMSNPKAIVTLGGNRTLSVSNPVNGMSYVLIVKQDATGSRTLTLPNSSWLVVNNGLGIATLTTTANAYDIITIEYDGTHYFVAYGRNFTGF
jgi:hypothetical protein